MTNRVLVARRGKSDQKGAKPREDRVTSTATDYKRPPMGQNDAE